VLIDLTPLRARAFRWLWIGRTISGLGGQMALVAVMFQVWESTRSTIWTGMAGLAQAAPLIAFGLLAGALVDRTDRKRVYATATACQAACAVLLAAQSTGPALLLAITATQSFFGAATGPAARTFIGVLLPKDQIAAGLALNRIAFQGAMLSGPALGGVVIGWAGPRACYLLDAGALVIAALSATGLPKYTATTARARVLDGLVFTVRNKIVRGALLTDLAATVLAMPISLFPLVNEERFGGDPRTLGLFLTAIAAGGVAASFFSGTFTRRPRPELVMVFGSALWGLSLALFGLVQEPWAGFAFLAIAGAADTVAVVSRGTVVQLHTPDELLGRVTAAEDIVGRAGPELGNLRGGLVAELTSGQAALVCGGVLCVAAVMLIARHDRAAAGRAGR
jgi:predicted MFS family arabinose efflux permease